jgi:hypothetical protein
MSLKKDDGKSAIKPSDVFDCPWTLTARIYDAPNGTIFVCAHSGLVSMGQGLARHNRPKDGLEFVLAPEELRKLPFQGIH